MAETLAAVIRTEAKRAAEFTLSHLPRRASARGDLVLAYHNVVDDDEPSYGDQSLHLRVTDFRRQLAVLLSEYDAVPLWTLLTTPQGRRPRMSITFDDAYMGAMTSGVSACREAGVPCTVFVAPGLLGRTPVWDIASEDGSWSSDDRRRFLSEHHGDAEAVTNVLATAAGEPPSASFRVSDEGELLSKAAWEGVTIGNHTWAHVNCAAISADRLATELERTRLWLQDRFGPRAIDVLAYPYGLSPLSDGLLRVVGDYCRFALRVDGGHMKATADTLALPRWNIPRALSINGFRARMRGWL